MTAQSKAQEEGQVRVNFRLEASLFNRFRAVARADHRTVSQELRRLMEHRIAEAEPNQMASVVDELSRAA